MILLLVKQAGVVVLASINAVLLVLALLAGRQKRPLPLGYFRILPLSVAVALFQLGMGFYFLIEGRQANPMHLFYGALVATGAALQFVVRPTTAVGQRYRNRPLIHAALALFVALLGIRSWLSG